MKFQYVLHSNDEFRYKSLRFYIDSHYYIRNVGLVAAIKLQISIKKRRSFFFLFYIISSSLFLFSYSLCCDLYGCWHFFCWNFFFLVVFGWRSSLSVFLTLLLCCITLSSYQGSTFSFFGCVSSYLLVQLIVYNSTHERQILDLYSFLIRFASCLLFDESSCRY